ncbi:hypothetical protein JHK84_053247 [Glycine max]|nr:hypothetical protein JHK85_054166 [Glycine max]KAG5083209.1 hypothetical protein JHK84_053247 [Glycine max]
MTKPFSMAEVKAALFSIGNYKTLGLNGYPMFFNLLLMISEINYREANRSVDFLANHGDFQLTVLDSPPPFLRSIIAEEARGVECVSGEVPVGIGIVEVDWICDLVLIGNLIGVFIVFAVLVDLDDPSLKEMMFFQTVFEWTPVETDTQHRSDAEAFINIPTLRRSLQ